LSAVLHLLQLLLEFFRIAPKLFLLIMLLRGLLWVLALLLGQLLLPFRQLLQLLQCFVDGLLLRIAAAALLRLFGALILILLGIEFQIEKALQIAGGPAAATTSSTASALSERHLNVAERRLRAQQVLQRLLLGLQRVLP